MTIDFVWLKFVLYVNLCKVVMCSGIPEKSMLGNELKHFQPKSLNSGYEFVFINDLFPSNNGERKSTIDPASHNPVKAESFYFELPPNPRVKSDMTEPNKIHSTPESWTNNSGGRNGQSKLPPNYGFPVLKTQTQAPEPKVAPQGLPQDIVWDDEDYVPNTAWTSATSSSSKSWNQDLSYSNPFSSSSWPEVPSYEDSIPFADELVKHIPLMSTNKHSSKGLLRKLQRRIWRHRLRNKGKGWKQKPKPETFSPVTTVSSGWSEDVPPIIIVQPPTSAPAKERREQGFLWNRNTAPFAVVALTFPFLMALGAFAIWSRQQERIDELRFWDQERRWWWERRLWEEKIFFKEQKFHLGRDVIRGLTGGNLIPNAITAASGLINGNSLFQTAGTRVLDSVLPAGGNVARPPAPTSPPPPTTPTTARPNPPTTPAAGSRIASDEDISYGTSAEAQIAYNQPHPVPSTELPVDNVSSNFRTLGALTPKRNMIQTKNGYKVISPIMKVL